MVLARAGHGLRAAGYGLIGLLLSCATGTAPVKLGQQTPVAAGFVLDFADLRKPEVPPPGFVDGVGAALSERNLFIKVVGPGEVFGSLRETGARMSHLATLAQGAPFLLLCETKVAFFSQLNGKYKWQVFAKVSVARAGEPQKALSAEVEFPALLDFDHEREAEALLAVVKVVAYRAGQVADRVIAAGAAPAPGPAAGPGDSGPIGPTPGATKGAAGAAGSGGGGGGGGRGATKVVVPRPADDLVYFVMVDRFWNGDRSNDGAVDRADPAAFHGGDLAGVIEKLDYLQGLGVRTVWLSPVFKMRTTKFHGFGAFHGYWVEDLGKVEPRFGTLETLRQLSDALHARKMRLVLDFVVNHVGPDAPLAREKPEWFHRNGAIKDWEDARQLTDFDVHGLPDLAQEREDVYAFLLGKARYWIDAVRPDGFRLDAVKHVPLAFWRRFNRDVKAYAGADFWMLGEVLDGRPSVLARTMREGEFDALFDFPVAFALKDVFCKGAHMGRLASVLSEDRVYDDPSKLVTLLDNHDLPRIASECASNLQGAEYALQALMTLRGTPSLTYGTEVGLAGEKEPENRAQMQFESDLQDSPPGLRRHKEFVQRWQAAFKVTVASRHRPLASPRITRLNSGEIAWHSSSPRGNVAFVAIRRETQHQGSQTPDPPLYRYSAESGVVSAATERASVRRIHWKVARSGLPPDAVIFISGSGRELGDWRREHALQVKGSGPFLEAEVVVPAGLVFSFKLIAVDRAGRVAWEPGDNRYVLVGLDSDKPVESRLWWGQA